MLNEEQYNTAQVDFTNTFNTGC